MNNVVKPIHPNATNLPIGDDFWRPIYRHIEMVYGQFLSFLCFWQ